MNMKNIDNDLCTLWSILATLYQTNNHSYDPSHYLKHCARWDWTILYFARLVSRLFCGIMFWDDNRVWNSQAANPIFEIFAKKPYLCISMNLHIICILCVYTGYCKIMFRSLQFWIECKKLSKIDLHNIFLRSIVFA